MSQRPKVDFPKARDLGPRDWGQEILLMETPHYIGKQLVMQAGKAGGLQYHREKIESFMLIQGQARVDCEGELPGLLASKVILPGDVVHVPAGAVHRVTALTDCVLYEWSTPVFNDRVRCEAEFGEPEVGGLPTTVPDATGHSG